MKTSNLAYKPTRHSAAKARARNLETRKGITDIQKKAPQPCAYDCGRSVYTIYAAGICNICRRQKGILVTNK